MQAILTIAVRQVDTRQRSLITPHFDRWQGRSLPAAVPPCYAMRGIAIIRFGVKIQMSSIPYLSQMLLFYRGGD